MRFATFSTVLALSALGCGQDCQQGDQASCDCPAGAPGSKLCLPNHTFGSCSCSGDMATTPQDLAGVDLSVGRDLVSDQMPDLALPTMRVVSGDVTLLGVTSDDQIIYQTAAGVFALPFGGAQPSMLVDAQTGWKAVRVSGRAVMIFEGDGSTLATWTAATGIHTSSPVLVSTGDVDPSGTLVWYSDPASAMPQQVRGAPIDLSSSTALYGSALVGRTRFLGNHLVVSHVAPNTSGPATVTSFDATWKGTDLELSANPMDPFSGNADQVAVMTMAGGLEVVPIGGGAPTQIASPVVAPGTLYSDSSAIVYLIQSGVFHLARSPLPNPGMPVILVNDVVLDFLSSDDKNVAYATLLGGGGATYNLFVTPAAAPGAQTPINGTTTNRFVAFSSDGAYLLFETGYDVASARGALTAQAVSGGKPATLGAGVGARVFPLTGTRVLFGANEMQGSADVAFTDLATGAITSVAIQTSGFAPDQAGDKVAYTVPLNGLWIASLP
jgi:hypothetical protein